METAIYGLGPRVQAKEVAGSNASTPKELHAWIFRYRFILGFVGQTDGIVNNQTQNQDGN